jgi:hypothetical protein
MLSSKNISQNPSQLLSNINRNTITMARFWPVYRRRWDNHNHYSLDSAVLGVVSWSSGTSTTRSNWSVRSGLNTCVNKFQC